MKRFIFAIISLSVCCLTQVAAQDAAAKAKPTQQPAVVLPPVIISATNPPKTKQTAEPENDKNHMTPVPNAALVPPTEIYRIGPGDVLDIRLLNFSTRQSSLFTVQSDGHMEYPYLSAPVRVAGLTADEIAARLNALIQVFDQPQAVVTVRHFASHNVIFSGLAGKSGPQALQREAVPLFAMLPLAQPLPEAQRVVVTRRGQLFREVSLGNQDDLNFLLEPGDEVNFLAAVAPPPVKKEFFYIIGTVNTPGQKEFHNGLTLTQAIFASGGLSKGKDAKVRVLRQTADGRLAPVEYSLKRISQGKDPDPVLQAGDRLEVFSKD
jgi:polysaccharide export outer membrane protein